MTSPIYSIRKKAHTGITVSSLPEAQRFWEEVIGCQVIYANKDLRMSEKLNVVGIPDAIMSTVLLRLPDDNVIELLEYSAPTDRKTFKPRPCDVGSVHLALEVEGSKQLIERATKFGWTAADVPQRLRRGDGSSWTAIYMFGPDGEALELMERLED